MEPSDFVSVVDDNLLCIICHCVMVDPCTCSQGHQFCFDCISTWLQQTPTCPSRCGDLAVDGLTKLRIVKNIIEKLQVRCCHRVTDGPSPGPKNLRRRSRANEASSEAGCDAKACGWVGAVGDRARHLKDECEYAEVDCSCHGCDTKVQRFQLAEHEARCEHRVVACENCLERIKAGERDGHLLACRMVEIECPQECGARLLRGDLGKHEESCANMVVPCSFASSGCEVRGKRKKMREHEEEAMVAHARLAARRAGRQQERIATLEKALLELGQVHAQKFASLAGRVRKLGEELASARHAATSETFGEARVTWKIDDFTQKAKTKSTLESKPFFVQTKAGRYYMQLSVQFYRKTGSVTQGFCGVFVGHVPERPGVNLRSGNFPVGLEGTTLTVEKGAMTETTYFDVNRDQLDSDGETLGCSNLLRTDKLRGLRWTDQDEEGTEVDGCNYDVTEFLDNDTLTVAGFVRITPPANICI